MRSKYQFNRENFHIKKGHTIHTLWYVSYVGVCMVCLDTAAALNYTIVSCVLRSLIIFLSLCVSVSGIKLLIYPTAKIAAIQHYSQKETLNDSFSAVFKHVKLLYHKLLNAVGLE